MGGVRRGSLALHIGRSEARARARARGPRCGVVWWRGGGVAAAAASPAPPPSRRVVRGGVAGSGLSAGSSPPRAPSSPCRTADATGHGPRRPEGVPPRRVREGRGGGLPRGADVRRGRVDASAASGARAGGTCTRARSRGGTASAVNQLLPGRARQRRRGPPVRPRDGPLSLGPRRAARRTVRVSGDIEDGPWASASSARGGGRDGLRAGPIGSAGGVRPRSRPPAARLAAPHR